MLVEQLSFFIVKQKGEGRRILFIRRSDLHQQKPTRTRLLQIRLFDQSLGVR